MKNQEAIVARLEVIESRLSAFNTEEPIIRLKTEAQKSSGADNREPES